MISEARKQSMAWMETDYSKHTYFRWKVKWRLEHLGALGTMGETAPSVFHCCARVFSVSSKAFCVSIYDMRHHLYNKYVINQSISKVILVVYIVFFQEIFLII